MFNDLVIKVAKSQMAFSIWFHFHKNKWNYCPPSCTYYVNKTVDRHQFRIFFWKWDKISQLYPHNCLMFSKNNVFYCFPCSCEHYSTKVIFLLSKKDGPFPYCCCCLVRQRCCNNFCRIFQSYFAWRPQKSPKEQLRPNIYHL